MLVPPSEFTEWLHDDREAEELIAETLVKYSSETAFKRMVEESRQSKQRVREVARRAASNMLRSFTKNKTE